MTIYLKVVFFFSIVHMDDQRTGISDCVSVVVAHGTGSKNLKVGTDSSQFWAKFSNLSVAFPFQIKEKCYLFGFQDNFIVNLV